MIRHWGYRFILLPPQSNCLSDKNNCPIKWVTTTRGTYGTTLVVHSETFGFEIFEKIITTELERGAMLKRLFWTFERM